MLSWSASLMCLFRLRNVIVIVEISIICQGLAMEIQTRGNTDPQAPLVLLFHGRGSNAQEIIELANHLPQEAN